MTIFAKNLRLSDMNMIYLKKQDRDKLKSSFGCSDGAISIALNFKSNSKLSYQLRNVAVNCLTGIPFINM